VKRGSAYDLFLARTLAAAEVVRGVEGVDVFSAMGLEAGAGIRQPSQRGPSPILGIGSSSRHSCRSVRPSRRPGTATLPPLDFLRDVVRELKAIGFVAESLVRAVAAL
jgi:polar amino acid transport system substrate-binding protein